MAGKNQSTGPQGEYYPPPPTGPPPGNDGLAMHPNEHPIAEPPSDLYDNYAPPVGAPPTSTTAQQGQTQQTAHQPPPPDSDGAPKKSSWSQRFSTLGSKAAVPFNMLANKLGSETFLPGTMDKEVEKASRILRAFCKDGIYTEDQAPETVEAPTTDAQGKPTTATAKPRKNRTLLTIPSKVINKAVGLAVFTTARAGFHVSGATGSGVLVARLPDGSWSPPSGIQVHSLGAGLMIGIDIYDCVVVINTREALEAFTKTRMSLGSDLAVVAGPWGAGGSVDFAAPKGKGKPADKDKEESAEAVRETDSKDTTSPIADDKTSAVDGASPTVHEPSTKTEGEQAREQRSPADGTAERPQAGKERKPSAFKNAIKQPTYSYVKSRGFYAGVQVDGTIVTERKDANAAFYGEAVSVQQILNGDVPLVPGKENWVSLVKPLFDTIKGAEGWHGQQQGGQWANQTTLDPSSTYGKGNAPAGYPAGYHPIFNSSDENPPPKPPRPTSGNVAGATAGVAGMSLDGQAGTPAARAKAAEAADEAAMNREREERERREVQAEMARQSEGRSGMAGGPPPPGYTETASGAADGAGEQPPAYVDDGVARSGVGDSKSGHTS